MKCFSFNFIFEKLCIFFEEISCLPDSGFYGIPYVFHLMFLLLFECNFYGIWGMNGVLFPRNIFFLLRNLEKNSRNFEMKCVICIGTKTNM